jgi:hypothetical protein
VRGSGEPERVGADADDGAAAVDPQYPQRHCEGGPDPDAVDDPVKPVRPLRRVEDLIDRAG